MRGKHISTANAIDDEKEKVRAHANSFPKTDSHYCRKNTRRPYLGSDPNLQLLYSLYKESAQEDERTPASLSSYKNIFYSEFNLGFHKDGCDFGVALQDLSDTKHFLKLDEYEYHRDLKDQPRLYRDRCKERVVFDTQCRAALFDL